MEKGLVQRVTALNRFLHDVYHDQEIIKAGIIPAEQILNNAQFRPEMMGVNVPHNVYSNISGIDIGGARRLGQRRVLRARRQPARAQRRELHAREPQDDDAALPRALQPEPHRAGRALPHLLLETLRASAPPATAEPTVVVLTPGMYNSAYFEHAFLAQQMGVELVEGQDLFVKDNFVYMRTTRGPKRVDVIYRRVDDDFLDPEGVPPDFDPGLRGPDARLPRRQRRHLQCGGHRRGRRQVDLPLRAEDGGVLPRREADLEERPTYMCRNKDELQYTLDNMKDWSSRKCTAPAATAC
ncbi:A circularly permuted ATPgrasp domain-containing protein [Ditylenchus destructor]|uniref:A circularly permuted ATPgrasp domain-containing protein n=1 Tax=Ditylenchus destructor TaxID=166010 RepID=A0AAD4QV19_9BILA|nr:A circularly permuted ATPgrasp domain-containing protein [Ditylenchus destructor]